MAGMQDRGPTVLAVTAAMIILATIFVFFRLVSRIGVVKKVTWDDYFIALAWVRRHTYTSHPARTPLTCSVDRLRTVLCNLLRHSLWTRPP